MRLKQIDLYRLQNQLCVPFKHSLASRTRVENLVVRVTTDTGVVGYGEGIPRQYVTGETFESSLRFLLDCFIPRLNGLCITGTCDLAKELDALVTAERRAQAPAAFCALELAILDAAGKSWGKSVANLLGGADQPLIYSAVLPMMPETSFRTFLRLIRELEMSFIKIKVGNEKDLETLALARRMLGNKVDLRVDANGAWGAKVAKERLAAMMPYDITAVEQPVPKNDIQGLKEVADSIQLPVIADESLCTEQDAKLLASLGACQVFNLRLSKCGGMLATSRLYEIGRKKGIPVQLGCHVGETGILASAGRHFAASRELLYLEGSYSKYLLRTDIVHEPVEFGLGGVAQHLEGPGLGVTVNEEVLQHLATMQQEIPL